MKFPKFKVRLIFDDGSLSEPRWVQFALTPEGWVTNISKASWMVCKKTRIREVFISSPRNEFFAPAIAATLSKGDTIHLLPQTMRIEWEQDTSKRLYPVAKVGWI